MPVFKYRDVNEMPDDTWHEPGSPELFVAIRASWQLAERLGRPRFPAGVHKHRSIEDAETLRELWERRNFEAFHERRRRSRESGEGQ